MMCIYENLIVDIDVYFHENGNIINLVYMFFVDQIIDPLPPPSDPCLQSHQTTESFGSSSLSVVVSWTVEQTFGIGICKCERTLEGIAGSMAGLMSCRLILLFPLSVILP